MLLTGWSVLVLAVYALSMRLSLIVLVFFFSVIPMWTPLITQYAGYQYFTYLNVALQDDLNLVLTATILVFLFSLAMVVGSLFYKNDFDFEQKSSLSLGNKTFSSIFALNLFLIFFFLESGNIIFSRYLDIKTGTPEYSSTVQQFFNFSVALMLASIPTKNRMRWFLIFLVLAFLISIIVSRRTMAVGIILIIIFASEHRQLRFRTIALGAAGLAILVLVGVLRDSGLTNFFSSESVEIIDAQRVYLAIPGGSANVFVSVIGVTDLRLSGNLQESFPMLRWAFGENESTIYASYGYQYNGGMHLATILSWNFGWFGMIVLGLGIGYLTAAADNVFRHAPAPSSLGFKGAVSAAYFLHIPLIFWYSPIGFIKLFTVLTVVFVGATTFNSLRLATVKQHDLKGGKL